MYTKALKASDVAPVEVGFPGVTMQMLTGEAHGDGMYVLTTMAPGGVIPAHSHSGADEFVYIVSGDFIEAGVSHAPGAVFYAIAGTSHGPHTTTNGCVVLTHFSAPLDFQPA